MSKTCQDIRAEFIAFFEQRGHTFVPSSPLLPAEDPTLLFTNAGMNQFKDIFLARETRDYVRAANSQKCIRAGGKHNDLEDVGHDCYHHTFFEMLGNWSFGDYFKADAIQWAWELLTDVWGLPKDRLYATVFEGDAADGLKADTEAADLWATVTDIDPTHILQGNKKDNFWEMGEAGPCGPCSEVHIDLTDDGSGGTRVNADDPEVIELWNLVFIQYNRDGEGVLTPLPAKHVDTGMGLERIGAVLAGKKSNYATDLFIPLIEKIETLTEHRYGATSGLASRFDVTSAENIGDVACRVIADHARTLTFAIADGVIPSNEGRGYVLRRILRRAARYGRQYLGIGGELLVQLVPTVVEMMGDVFTEIRERQDYIIETIRAEEEAFGKTLDNGIKTWWSFAGKALFQRLNEDDRFVIYSLEASAASGENAEEEIRREMQEYPHSPDTNIDVRWRSESEGTPNEPYQSFKLGELTKERTRELCKTPPEISGESAFKLYATYGFPIDLTQLMAKERGLDVDIAGFDHEMAQHREISSAGAAFKADEIPDLPATDDAPKYGVEPVEAKVLGWVVDGTLVDTGTLAAGGEAGVVLDRTNFYAEQGGQVGDAGHLTWDGGKFAVRDTQPAGGGVLHVGVVEQGSLRAGETVHCEIDASRVETMRNHTATHLMNWALREVLGEHISQAGSVVAPDRLRFDFSHNQALTGEQLAEVERLVNERVLADEAVTDEILPLAEAKEIPGVRAMFGEKYPDPVRVISMGPEASRAVEFCGGTHLKRTSPVGLFKILSEESVAKGVRRITAVTGRGAVEHMQQLAETVRDASTALRVPPDEIGERIGAMQQEIKKLRKAPAAASGGGAEGESIYRSEDGSVLVIRLDDVDAGQMRGLCDRMRQSGAAAIFVGGSADGKVTLVAMVDEALVASAGVKAGDWVNAAAALVGGRGGGKPTLAQAGGKDAGKLPAALDAAVQWIQKELS